MSENERFEMDAITLERLLFQSLSMLPSGVSGVKIEQFYNYAARHMVMSLRGYVLAENAGPDLLVSVTRKLRPRWIPRWLWGLLKDDVITKSATPKYLYPNANIRVPELGAPVRFMLPR